MVGSGSTAAMRALPTDDRAGRTPFRTVRGSSDQVDENRMAIRGGLPGSDIVPASTSAYRKSYIAGESSR